MEIKVESGIQIETPKEDLVVCQSIELKIDTLLKRDVVIHSPYFEIAYVNIEINNSSLRGPPSFINYKQIIAGAF